MAEQYFSGIRVGDEIFIAGLGKCVVHLINDSAEHPLSVGSYGCRSFDYRQYNYDGVRYNETLQSAFWSDPGIVAPPRPKRMKKVKVEVRPYISPFAPGNKMVLASEHEEHMGLPWCGPSQFIEIEIEND